MLREIELLFDGEIQRSAELSSGDCGGYNSWTVIRYEEVALRINWRWIENKKLMGGAMKSEDSYNLI